MILQMSAMDNEIPPAYITGLGDGYMFLRCAVSMCLERIVGDAEGWNLDDLVDAARKHQLTCGTDVDDDDDEE